MIIVRHNAACIAIGAEVLARIKRKGRRRPERAHETALVGCKMRLRAVFYHPEAMPLGDGHDRVHVGGLPIEVDGDDAHGPGCDFRLELRRVDRESHWVDIAKYDA